MADFCLDARVSECSKQWKYFQTRSQSWLGPVGSSPSPCSSPVNLILEPPAPSPLHLLKRGSCPRCLALEELNSSSGRPESNHRFVYLDSCFENSKSQENQRSSRASPHRPPIHLHRAQPFILTSTLDPAWV